MNYKFYLGSALKQATQAELMHVEFLELLMQWDLVLPGYDCTCTRKISASDILQKFTGYSDICVQLYDIVKPTEAEALAYMQNRNPQIVAFIEGIKTQAENETK